MRACPLPAALAALAALLAAAQPARAAYVGVTRMDDDAGQGQIAVVSFTSISRARECIYDGLSGIGAQGAAETADAVISWLAMLPSLDCADLSRRATVILVTPPEGQDLPDQVALIPLAPLNGERLLRSSLAEAYTSVSGRGVVYCSGARSDSVPPSLSLIVTRDTAFVASSRESLRWIARHWRDGTIPAIPDVRDGATISAFFDAPIMAGVIGHLLADADPDGDARGAVRALAVFRDQLTLLDALHVSLSADIHNWRLSARLTLAGQGGLPLPPAATPTGAALAAIPRDAYCVADSRGDCFKALLPESLLSRFRSDSSYSLLLGASLLPGLPDEAAAAIVPSLDGESASAFVVSKATGLDARVKVLALKDPAGAAAALASLLPWGTENAGAVFHRPRESADDGRAIYSYTAKRQVSSEMAEDYAAGALVLMLQFNRVEMAIDEDRLVVVTGPQGSLERLLALDPTLRRTRTPAELTRTLGELPEGETALGGGALEPSRTVRALIEGADGLEAVLRQLPRPGGGVVWRLSRREGDVLFDVELASTELFATSILRGIDQRHIGGILLDHIIGGNKAGE